ncbi:MAG: hypothetical protein LBQ88_17050 [Treponema sp.]|jgi:hypothetical protein|nr:hypothetical protein [Treponema sp.]
MAKYWYQENLRFLQTVLREVDIIDYDAKKTVAYMEQTNANCLVINAGGVIDFFDNPLEMSNPNRFMTGEILPGICGEIHRAGKRVIARIDFRGVEPRRYNLHPDWFSLDQDGNPRVASFGGAKITRPCYHSYYTNEHGAAILLLQKTKSFIPYLFLK